MRTHLTAAAVAPTARAIGILFAALAAGCGGSSDAMERQLGELRAELVKVRADSAVLADRLEALERAERAGAPRPAQAVDAPRRAPSSDRPDLEVVRLVPVPDAVPPPRGDSPAPPPPSASPLASASARESASASPLAAASASSVGPTELPEVADGPRPVLRSTRDGGVTADAPPAPRLRLSTPPPPPPPPAPIRSSSAPKRTP